MISLLHQVIVLNILGKCVFLIRTWQMYRDRGMDGTLVHIGQYRVLDLEVVGRIKYPLILSPS